MAYKIPLSNKTAINFEYFGTNRFSALRWNPYMQCWVCDAIFNDEKIVYSLALRAGVNVLHQFNVPFNIYIVNTSNPVKDPGNFSSLTAFIFTDTDIQDYINSKAPDPNNRRPLV